MSERKTAVIVGATGGIGRALCARLHDAGYALVVGSRREAETRALAGELGAIGQPVDARIAQDVEALFARAQAECGRVDVAVNLAGSILLKPAHLTTDADWAETIATNLTTSFHVLRQAVRSFDKAGGAVVLVSTAAATHGLASHEAVAAAKAGVEGLARAAAASYGSRGIRVNVVAPGLTRTRLAERITSSPAALEASESMHVLGRIAEPDDVAAVIELAMTNPAMTGAVIPVDGGLANVRPK
jgi:3-oxoacyl-[acyl-carrier protein] reductase